MRVSSMPIVGKIPRPASDRPDQNFWPAAPTSGLATRVLLWGHVRNFRRIPFSPRERLPFVHLFPRVSRSKEEGVEERESVACSTNFTNFREMEGGASSRASSTSGRPTLWSRRNRELERDKGELGWKLGVVRFESQILERWGGYFFQSFWVPGAIRTLFDSLQMHRTLLWTVPSHRGF